MSPLVVAGISAVVLAVLLLAWSILARPDRARQLVLDNLRTGQSDAAAHAVAEESAGSSVLTSVARALTPGGTVERLERLLARAGRPVDWPVDRLLAAKIVLPVVLAGLSALYINAAPGAIAVLVGAAVTIIAYFLPELLLHSRGQKRSQQIGLELADTLDQMTISVEAGLGFDAAIAKAGSNGKGPLAEELVRTLQDIQVGRSRRAAYESLATRTEAVDLRRFIRAVIQADKYGIAIAGVLRTQAAEMRLKRRQRAEEKAMQIPVKVIFPLMLCILPVLFIVLLGPAAMDIMKAFSH